jgi:transcriptional regulator with XRE-family HTH domain
MNRDMNDGSNQAPRASPPNSEAGGIPDPESAGNLELGRLIKFLRQARRASLRDVAATAHCSASFLSMIEHGQISPSVRSLRRICDALATTPSDLLRPEVPTPDPVVVRRSEAKGRVIMRWEKAMAQLLLPPETNCQFTLMVTKVKPGGQTSFRISSKPLPELHLVIRGRPTFFVNDSSIELRAGDSIYFDLTRPHKVVNGTRTMVELLAINPSGFHLIDDLEGNHFPAEG